jgi:hypothetical protein
LDFSAVVPNKNSEYFSDSEYKKYWRIMANEASQFKISDVFSTKGGMMKPTCQKMLKIIDENKTKIYLMQQWW